MALTPHRRMPDAMVTDGAPIRSELFNRLNENTRAMPLWLNYGPQILVSGEKTTTFTDGETYTLASFTIYLDASRIGTGIGSYRTQVSIPVDVEVDSTITDAGDCQFILGDTLGNTLDIDMVGTQTTVAGTITALLTETTSQIVTLPIYVRPTTPGHGGAIDRAKVTYDSQKGGDIKRYEA